MLPAVVRACERAGSSEPARSTFVRRPPVRPAALVTLLGAVCALAVPAGAHENSRSRSLLALHDGHLSHFVKLEAESVWEVLPLDRDGNLLVEQDEFDAVRDDIARYVSEHVVLYPDGGEILRGRPVAVELVTDDRNALAFKQWVELELLYDLPVVPRRLEIEVSLFLDTSPKHQDLCDVVWADGPESLVDERVRLRFWAGDPRQVADSGRPPPAPSFGAGLWAGAHTVALAPLALLCLAALLVGLSSRADRAGVAGGHPLADGSGRVLSLYATGLALSLCLGAVLTPHVTQAGAALAAGLAVAWVGALNLLRRSERPVWVEALVFGLLMGLGHEDLLHGGAELAASPLWELVTGAAFAALLIGWVISRVLGAQRWGALARPLVSASAVFAGSLAAWTSA